MLKYLVLLSVVFFTGCSFNGINNIELNSTHYKGFDYATVVKRDTYVKTKLEFQFLGNKESEDLILILKSKGKYRLKDLESIVFVSKKLIVKPNNCNFIDSNNEAVAQCTYNKNDFFKILNGKSFYILFNTKSGSAKYTTTVSTKYKLNKGKLDYCVSYARNMITYFPHGDYNTIYYDCLNSFS
ncbi:MAG: hypothetical protein WBG69_07015, partial [Arcobacteraceae bacterium]